MARYIPRKTEGLLRDRNRAGDLHLRPRSMGVKGQMFSESFQKQGGTKEEGVIVCVCVAQCFNGYIPERGGNATLTTESLLGRDATRVLARSGIRAGANKRAQEDWPSVATENDGPDTGIGSPLPDQCSGQRPMRHETRRDDRKDEGARIAGPLTFLPSSSALLPVRLAWVVRRVYR